MQGRDGRSQPAIEEEAEMAEADMGWQYHQRVAAVGAYVDLDLAKKSIQELKSVGLTSSESTSLRCAIHRR